MTAEATLDPATFDAAAPQRFYLPDHASEDLEALADVALLADGARLPAHSQVLALQSGVLRGLFVDFKGAAALELEEPFCGCSLFGAALFLRLAYNNLELTAANLEEVRDHLPALLHLAHKLDAPRIQAAVAQCMQGALLLRRRLGKAGLRQRLLMPAAALLWQRR